MNPAEALQPNKDDEKEDKTEDHMPSFKPSQIRAARILYNSIFFPYSTSWINLLQFAAKAHEILMQISIATVIAAYLQHLFTHPAGMPFGAMFAAYSATQYSYLWSHEFLASLTSPGFLLSRKLGFVFLVPGSILLAGGVGPATAIAMVPRYVNFTVPSYSMAFNGNYADIFPRTFTAPDVDPDSKYLEPTLTLATGWEKLRNLPVVGKQADSGVKYNLQHNVTICHRTLATLQHIAVANTLNAAAQAMLGASPEIVLKKTAIAWTEAPQPFASSLWYSNDILGENDTRPIEFPVGYITGEEGFRTAEYPNTTRQQIWKQNNDQHEGRIIWVDDILFNTGAGIGALVIQPDLCDNGKVYLSVSACAVGAMWANITTKTRFGADVFDIQNALPTTFVNDLPAWSQHGVSMSKTWANNITSQIGYQNKTVADNLLRCLLITSDVCRETLNVTDYPRSMTHEGLLSSLIANAMSLSTRDVMIYSQEIRNGQFPRESIFSYFQPPHESPVFPIHLQTPGYAWTMDGTGIKIAIPVLRLYCLYVTSYVVYTFAAGSSSLFWDTVAKLTMLAVNTTPTELVKNTSNGRSKQAAFRHLVNIQEVKGNEQLELVFDKDKESRRPVGLDSKPSKTWPM